MDCAVRKVLMPLALSLALVASPAAAGGPPEDNGAPHDEQVAPATSCDLCAAINRLSDAVRKEDRARVQREKDDLAAQESMAASAELMVGPTRGQFWVALFGVVGLVSSLGLSFLAFAQTRGALKQQRESAELELRAYLGISKVVITDVAVGKEPDATISIFNHGSTPAYRVKEEVELVLVPYGIPLPFDRGPVETSVTINPGEASRTFTAMNGYILTAADIAALTIGDGPGGAILLLVALVKYETFGAVRTLEFAAARWGATGNESRLIPDHNWAD